VQFASNLVEGSIIVLQAGGKVEDIGWMVCWVNSFQRDYNIGREGHYLLIGWMVCWVNSFQRDYNIGREGHYLLVS
jgi:hypothetical protein